MLGWLLTLALSSGEPLRLRIETWQAPALEVAKRLDDLHDAVSLAKFRAECLAGAPGVTLISSPALAVDSSTKEALESITERMYPTEYEPQELAGSFISKEEPPKSLPAPTSFETRNTGPTVEATVEASEGEEKTWILRLGLEDVTLVGSDTYGETQKAISMPAFTTFRITTDLSLKEGQWRLASVQEPPRGIEGKRSDLRWITLVRIDEDK